MISETLKDLRLNEKYKHYGIFLASLMFIWSGIDKINNFDKKVQTLMKKTNFSYLLSSSGMILVILLETVGMFILLDYYCKENILPNKFTYKSISFTKQELVQFTLLCLLAFLVVVTLIYHPFNLNHPIPFLSNLTTFGLFLYVYSDLFHQRR